MNSRNSLPVIAAAAIAMAGFAAPAAADAVADFYKGKTITVVVAAGPGGGHTQYTQYLAPYLEKYMPGNPNFIVQNMGGAGGTKGANFLYSKGRTDGTMIGILLSDTPLASRLRTTGVKYVASEFQFLGGADQPRSAFIVYKSTGVKSIDDAKSTEVVLGSTGKGSQTYVVPTLINSMLGTKFKVITGYRGMGGIYIALDKKEVAGFQSSWSGIKIARPHLVDQLNLLATNALTPLKDRPDVPLLKDLVKNPEDKQIAELLGGNMILGRGWLAPPGVPADRVAALRAAFKKSFEDPEAIAGAEQRKMTWESATWQEMQAAAERITKTDQAIIDRMQAALGLKKK
ncbi:MAG: tripartite tricarboxylate transporter substrate-binding protein [Proteobacteria bacterium]|nr:tripartite tricarboxylate transporter substrate-binding protein [Pseudomonadota bacterium]